jgi:hypothetical protein
MTNLRRFALKILNVTVRLASPGARDWANAMSRELDFIENDWTALRWAVGSTKIVFKRRDVPLADPSDIVWAGQSLMKKIRRRTLGGYAVTLSEAAIFGLFIFIVPNSMQRVGCCLTVAAMLYCTYQLYARRPGDLPLESDSSACTDSFRAELERQRDFHRGIWFWSRLLIMLPGLILFCVGGAMAQPELARGFAAIAACLIVLGIVSVPLNLRLSHKYQRQIDELDALPKDS